MIVAGEGLSALLLLTYPIVGLVFTVAMMTPIAMFGPTALTTTIYAMALAFLRDEDGALLREALGRHWRGLLAACVVAAAAVLWLLVGVQHFRFAIYAVFVATLLVGLSRVIADRWRSGSALRNLRPQLPRPGRMAGSTRALVGSFALLALANGLSPYVGPKFRLSMAMFSNLRVDDERWNHLLVPRALHLAEGDGHVHVTHVEKSRATRHRQAQLRQHHERAFDPGLYTPASFATRLQTLRATRGRANVTLTWRGKRYVFSDAANSAGLAWLVGTLPRNSKWFQSALAAHGPQPCVH